MLYKSFLPETVPRVKSRLKPPKKPKLLDQIHDATPPIPMEIRDVIARLVRAVAIHLLAKREIASSLRSSQ
jgi:hypothetical protein